MAKRRATKRTSKREAPSAEPVEVVDLELVDEPGALVGAWGGYPSADRNPGLVYLGGLGTESGRRSQLGALNRAASVMSGRTVEQLGGSARTLVSFPWHGIGYQHVARLRSELAAEAAPATVNRILSAVRGVVRESWRLGYVSDEEKERALDVRSVKSHREPAGRRVTAGEIAAIFHVCRTDPGPLGPRDATALALLYGAGLRRSEVCGLNVEDWNRDDGFVLVRGKGGKERRCALDSGTTRALVDWLDVRGDEPGPLLCSVTRHGTIVRGRGISSQAVYAACEKRRKQAGVPAFTPHDLRRSFASDSLDAGTDLATVQRAMGHSSPATTSRYDRRGDEALRKNAERVVVPYAGRAA